MGIYQPIIKADVQNIIIGIHIPSHKQRYKKTIKYTCIPACTFNPKFKSSPINETDNTCTILQKTVDTFTNFACTCF